MDPKIGGSISTSATGADLSVHAAQRLGSDNANVVGGVFAGAHTGPSGPQGITATGAFAAANVNGHSLSMEHTQIPKFGNITKETVQANVFDNGNNRLDVSAMHSHTHRPQISFDSVGANAALSNHRGHSIQAGVTHIPKFDMTTMNVQGTARLAEFGRGNTLDLTGQASRHLSGPFAGRNDIGASLGMKFPF